jgi:hypothetical protein
MSEVSNAVAIYGLQASLATEQTNASGIVPVGPSQTQRTFLDADVAYAFRANLPTSGDSAKVNLSGNIGDVTPITPDETPPSGNAKIYDLTGAFTNNTGTKTQPVPVRVYYAGNDGTNDWWTSSGEIESGWAADTSTMVNGDCFVRLNVDTSATFAYKTIQGLSVFNDSEAVNSVGGLVWSGNDDETGTPLFVEFEYVEPSLIDTDGKDIYGQPIPTVDEINGLLIECVSGTAKITTTADDEVSISSSGIILFANTDANVWEVDDITITATSDGTAVKVTVIGQAV